MESQTKSSDLDPQTIAMANVFDEVWDRFIAAEGTAADTPDNRGVLAARIVVLFRTLGVDESQIEAAALIFMRALVAAMRIGAHHSAPPIVPFMPFSEQGASFDPEAVAAMSEALALCLDELPMRIPSDAHAFLRTAILNLAQAGERDAARMHAAAMQALSERH